MASEQDNIAATRAGAGEPVYQATRAEANPRGVHVNTDLQGGGKPRPYPITKRLAKPSRVGAGLAPALRAPALDVQTQLWIAWAILLLAILVYAVLMSQEAVLRYDTFKATAFDLGNMDQVLWNTIHGRPFQFTNQAIDWYGPPTRLAVHFEPIILPLSLLYLFHADPRILLVFQTLALVSGAFPVFLLTRKYLSEWPLLAAMMAIAYLISPALLGLNIFDFHPVSLATPLILYAVLALTHKQYACCLIACILAAATKEDVPLAIAMLGILVTWRYKSPRLGTTLLIGGVLWSFLAFFVIIPHFYPGAQHNNFWYRYESLGDTPTTAVLNLLLHPWLVFSLFITFDRLFYVAGLLRSSGFLALLAPEWLLPVLPSLAVNLLSTDPLLYSGLYQYNAVIIPFVMLAAIHGTRRLITIWQEWRGDETQTTNPILYTHEASRAGASPTRRGVIHHAPTRQSGNALRNRVGVPLAVALAPLRRSGNNLRALALRAPALLSRVLAFPILATWQTRFLSLVHVQWRRFSERMVPLACHVSIAALQQVVIVWIIVMLVVNSVLILPTLNGFWADHQPGSREQHIQQLLDLISPDASVSAGDNLNPHLSERQRLAVFPSPLNTSVEYIIVDLNAVFPENRTAVARELNQLVASGQFRELGRAEGVVLLVRRS